MALWGGGAVHCYSPGGEPLARAQFPATQVTACAFGGPDLSELYVTTSRHGLEEGAQPEAGTLFRLRPGVRSLPPHRYSGY